VYGDEKAVIYGDMQIEGNVLGAYMGVGSDLLNV